MILSKNFSLAEMTVTNQKLDNTPTPEQVILLQHLVTQTLQPLRDSLGKSIRIHSGFRSGAVNKAVGGAANSHHMCLDRYAAADISVAGMTPEELVKSILKLGLPFEQLITEPTWVHVSLRRPLYQVLNKSGRGV